jgi:hypothetical protein
MAQQGGYAIVREWELFTKYENGLNIKEEIYRGVISDVVNQVREAFLDEGVDIEVLQQLKKVLFILPIYININTIFNQRLGKLKYKLVEL